MKTREQKREEAQQRQRARARRTPEEQLALLRKRGIMHGHEYERLLARCKSRAND